MTTSARRKWKRELMVVGIVVGLIGGAAVTWVVAHLYYRAANRSQYELFKKLSGEVRSIILDDARDSLTVEDLNDLLATKTLDKDSTRLLPYKACPKCGSANLKHKSGVDSQIVDTWDGVDQVSYDREDIKCVDCGWEATESGEGRLTPEST